MLLSALNPILKRNAGVAIEEGTLKKLSFNFQYDEETSNGELIFEYDGLKVSLIDRADQSKKGFQTFLTNTFILHKKNIKGSNSFRKGDISFERNKKRSLFNYWWKSLSSGLKSTAVL
jgi:hypothetical protein